MLFLPLILNAVNVILMSTTILCILTNWKSLTAPES